MRSRLPLPVLAAILCAFAACTDPRPRPAPPTVTVSLTPGHRVTSPGSLTGTVYVWDDTGIDSIRVAVSLGSGLALGDSAYFPSDDPFRVSIPLNWRVQGGVPTGTSIRVVSRAVSYLRFATVDSAATTIQDTVAGRR